MELGPAHPASAGLLRGSLQIRDDTVTSIDPQPGALHRGVELILPARDYRQALSLVNRHDWQAPFFGEWALARLVEKALGIDVPPRARWLRAIHAERSRVLSHLGYLEYLTWVRQDPALTTRALREDFRRSSAAWTGNRLHPMIVRLGGIGRDLPPTWISHESQLWQRAVHLAEALREVAQTLPPAIAVVTPDIIGQFGLSGPVARASGVSEDLQRTRNLPSSLADSAQIAAGPRAGDAASRFEWLALEIIESVGLLERLQESIPEGPVTTHLPKVVKLPEGDVYTAVAAPLGRATMVVTSRGEKTPWRLRLRTPSGANVSAWTAAVPGTTVADLPTALASLPWVAGDLDK